MIHIESWLEEYQRVLNDTFGERVWFVGLQGSYSRGEATETSDIDLVVILDKLSATDISLYHNMLDALPYRKRICGFLSGKEEIFHWEPSDLFQFCHDTTPIKGTLDKILALVDEDSVARAIKIGACNIYHGCVHNMLYEKSEDILHGLFKAASFVVQAIAFQQTGTYFRKLRELIQVVSSKEKGIIEIWIALREGSVADFDVMSETLFNWAKEWVTHNS